MPLTPAAPAAAVGARSLPPGVRRFLDTEAAGGLALVVAAAVALVWANSPWHASYEELWHTQVRLTIGGRGVTDDLRHLVNDGLMALFFLVVGLEVKRELVAGDLRDRRVAALPVLAALGGMVVPAALYLAVNAGAVGAAGWGVPMATDIAFALAVLALLGPRVPPPLKLFLLTLAIVDDIGAIVVIAVAYTDHLDPRALAVAAGFVAAAAACVRARVSAPAVYVVLGAGCWLALYHSGVHATLAGVAFGLLAPARPPGPGDLERRLHPYTSFLVVPIFALANAGVRITGDELEAPGSARVAAGVVVGLVVGKAVGVTAASALAVRLRLSALPEGVTWAALVGVAALAGVGFTVSLFVSGLAFDRPGLQEAAVLGVLLASVIAAVIGVVVLLVALKRRPNPNTV